MISCVKFKLSFQNEIFLVHKMFFLISMIMQYYADKVKMQSIMMM